MVVFGSVVAYGASVFALSKLPTSTTSLYAYFNPVIALFLGWIILEEKLNFQIAVAAVVIMAGVFMGKQGTARLKNS